jgi:uncharacterized membrane protein YoaK (UPF0700 family)
MFPNAPAAFILTVIIAGAIVLTVGFSAVWAVFALTLVVTTVVAIHRSIPRRER